MLHKGLAKNNKSARHNIVKSADKGDNSAVIYNSINPQWVAHAGPAPWKLICFSVLLGLLCIFPLN